MLVEERVLGAVDRGPRPEDLPAFVDVGQVRSRCRRQG